MKRPGGIARFLGRLAAPVVLAALEEIGHAKTIEREPIVAPARTRLLGRSRGDTEVREFIDECYSRDLTIPATLSAARAKFGVRRVPSRSSIGRYFKNLDETNIGLTKALDERHRAIKSIIRQTVKDGLASGQFDSALKRTIRDQGESS